VERFILFGSHARGTAIKGSDYDVIVVSPDFADVPFLERMRLVRALWHFPAGLDCICYTPEEFTRKMDEIGVISEAVKEGIQVV
jgi:predicted nucleotidyltransferase